MIVESVTSFIQARGRPKSSKVRGLLVFLLGGERESVW